MVEVLAKVKGWRTIAFNVGSIVAVVGVELVQYMAADTSWSSLLGERAALAICAINLANIVLRAVTNTKIGCDGCSRS